MSKKKKSESHQGQAKPQSSNKAITVIILLAFLGIMPILVWVSLPEESPYTSATSASDMVLTAADAAGMQICSSNAITVKVPGATSAVLYQLSPDCIRSSSATTVQILVVGFSSTEAQMSAIATAENTYQNWPTTNTAAFMSGYNVLVVQGAPGNTAVEEISASLIDQGAVRII